MSLNEIMTQVRGLSYSKKDSTNTAVEGYLPVLRAGNIQDARIIEEDYVYVPKQIVKEKQYLKFGDILIAASSGSISIVGKAAMLEKDMNATFGAFCKVLRPDTKKIDNYYFKHFFQTSYYKRTIKSLAEGANINNLKTQHFDDLNIPLPPLDQQKKIATILDTADAYRQKTKALIDKYDALTQSLFLDMFGDPALNPKNWELKSCGNFIKYLADIGSNGANKTVSKNLVMSDSKDYAIMIRTTNFSKNDFENNLKYVSKEVYDFFKKSQIFGGEIIMNKIGSAGDFWIMPNLNKPVSLGLNQFVIRLKDISLIYFYYFLSTDYGTLNIKSRCNGVATKSITKTAVRELPILNPPMELQNQFAERVKAIETQKTIAQQELDKADNLFNSLLQKAFKGELI